MPGSGTGTPSIPGTATGYLSISEANAYFLTRLYSTAWTGTDAVKTAALTTAFDRLYYSDLFDLPLPAAATVDQLVVLKKAQCEMALYMLLHLADEDRRKGLQAQGVNQAGIVKETYEASYLSKVALPPIVYDLLEDMLDVETPFFITDLRRNEDKLANESVTDEEDYR
jgi:hypothetical protein